MITNVREERLLVVSDIHLGNHFLDRADSFLRFLSMVSESDYSLCVNGDGIDILQTSLLRMTRDLSQGLHSFARLMGAERRLYYLIGNHDIVLEHFLDDFRMIRLAPFLNVKSGDKRFRVEHGHLYDPKFVVNPDRYFQLTRLAGLALRIHPSLYRLHDFEKRVRAWFRARRMSEEDKAIERIEGEHPSFLDAVNELTSRGFDAVVFGHTHHHGQVTLGDGAMYFNTGSWFHEPHYVKIDHGDIEMVPWKD